MLRSKVCTTSWEKWRELKNYECTKTHFAVAGNSRTDEFYWMIQENFKKWSGIIVEKNSHVPSQPARIPSPRAMPSCDRRLPLDTWHRSGSQENVSANPRSTLESSQTPYRGIHQFATSSAADGAPAFISTKRLVAREEERIGNAIPMPTFARRPPTMNAFMPVDISLRFYGWTAKTADIGTSIW